MSVEPGRYRFATFAIAILMTAVYLAGNGQVGLWDRDEPRYAQTSRQMLKSEPGDWVVPRLLDTIRTAKPIFIYWCEAGSMAVFGDNDFAARVPSGLAVGATLAFVGMVVGRGLGWRRAMYTVLVLGTSGLTIAAGKMCITDGVLLLWVTITQACLCRIYMGKETRATAPMMWIAASLAMLTKGPVVLGVSGATLLVLLCLDGFGRGSMAWWKRTRPVMGLWIAFLICAPWLVLLHVRCPEFLPKAFGHEIVDRATKPLEGHKGPPGYYLATIWGTFFPWSVMLPAVLVVGWKNRRRRIVRFSMAGVIGPWILWELIQTKLAHYILPVFPPLALLTADLIVRCIQKRHPDLTRRLNVVPVSIWSMAVIALGMLGFAGIWRFPEYRAALAVPSAILAGGAVAWSMVVWVLWFKRKIAPAVWAMAGGMAVCLLWIYVVVLPRAEFLWLPQRIAAILRSEGAVHVGDCAMIDYQEDSLYWYQGGTISRPDDDYFRITPREQWRRWIVMPDRLWDKQPAAVRAAYEEIARRHGLAYADRMKVLDVVVIRRRD